MGPASATRGGQNQSCHPPQPGAWWIVLHEKCLITRCLWTEQCHGLGGFKCVLQEYQRCFHKTKEKLEQTPNERQFDFSEMYIFGKFDTFQRRLNKILEMFSTISTYFALQDSKIEGLETMATRFQVGVLWPRRVCTLAISCLENCKLFGGCC